MARSGARHIETRLSQSSPASLVGGSGIVSGEAFGSGGLVLGGTVIVGSTGIPSAGAFGSGGNVAFRQFITGNTGIPSAEAFGHGFVSYPQFIIGATGIPSGEAFGVGGIVLSLGVPDETNCDLVLLPWVPDTTSVTTTSPIVGSGPLATGSGSGTTLVLTLTQDITTDCVLMVVAGAASVGNPLSDTTLKVLSVADTQGGTWPSSLDLVQALIGDVRQIVGSLGNETSVVFGPAIPRPVTAGGLSAGDQITVTFDADYPASVLTAGAVFAFTGAVSTAALTTVSGGTARFGNSDSYPDESVSNRTLNWATDWGGSNPIEAFLTDTAVIAVSMTYPATSGYEPYEGVLVGEYSSSSLSLAVSLRDAVPAGTIVEPGGSWQTGVSAIVGNYQGLVPISATVVSEQCDLDLEPEVENCDLVLEPLVSRVLGSRNPPKHIVGSAGIVSGEAFGTGGSVISAIGSIAVGSDSGIPSGEAFGVGGFVTAGAIRVGTDPGAGIPTAGAFGVGGKVTLGSGVLFLVGGTGIVSRETFGAGGTLKVTVKGAAGIPTGEAFGTTGILNRIVAVRGSAGIVSAGAFGTGGKAVRIIKGSAGIPAPDSFGVSGRGKALRPGPTLVDNHFLLVLTWQA